MGGKGQATQNDLPIGAEKAINASGDAILDIQNALPMTGKPYNRSSEGSTGTQVTDPGTGPIINDGGGGDVIVKNQQAQAAQQPSTANMAKSAARPTAAASIGGTPTMQTGFAGTGTRSGAPKGTGLTLEQQMAAGERGMVMPQAGGSSAQKSGSTWYEAPWSGAGDTGGGWFDEGKAPGGWVPGTAPGGGGSTPPTSGGDSKGSGDGYRPPPVVTPPSGGGGGVVVPPGNTQPVPDGSSTGVQKGTVADISKGTNIVGDQTYTQVSGVPTNFTDKNVRQIASRTGLMRDAAEGIGGMRNPPPSLVAAEQLGDKGMAQASQRPMGAGLPGGQSGMMVGGTWYPDKGATGNAASSAFDAAKNTFNATIAPDIANKRSMMGLGNSNAVTKDMSQAWAGMALPLINDELGREERAIERGTNATFQNANLKRGIAGDNTAREFTALDKMMNYGQIEQGTNQAKHDAAYEDFLRRQGISEKAVYTPFGQAAAAGGTTTKLQGLFK